MTDKVNPENQEDKINLENEKINNYISRKLKSLNLDDVADKSKKEIAKLVANKLSRERLKWKTFTKELVNTIYQKSFLSNGTETRINYSESIANRTMTEKDYNKIMQQIAEYNSILPVSHRRDWGFWWWIGDIILSSTTWKMYCVENKDDRQELLEDYNWRQYYSSRSWNSGKWDILHEKKVWYIYQQLGKI